MIGSCLRNPSHAQRASVAAVCRFLAARAPIALLTSIAMASLAAAQQPEPVEISAAQSERMSIVAAPEWPASAFAPYVDATAWPPLDLVTAAKELGVRRFRLGFVVAQSPTQATPTWGGVHSATSSYRLREINSLRVAGGDVAIAFGGAVGVELAAAAKSAVELAAAYKSVIDAYDARVVDYDIEGAGLADRPTIERRAQALAILQKLMTAEQRPLQIWFTLPVQPAGLTPDGMNVIRAAIERGVDIRGVNAMAMDYGEAIAPQPAGRMGLYAIEAARNLHRQLVALYAAGPAKKPAAKIWEMIGITPMIGRNDVAGEIFQQSDAAQLLDFAMQSRIALLSFWSLNRDRPCEQPQAAASPLCSGISQRGYEFTRVFNRFGRR